MSSVMKVFIKTLVLCVLVSPAVKSSDQDVSPGIFHIFLRDHLSVCSLADRLWYPDLEQYRGGRDSQGEGVLLSHPSLLPGGGGRANLHQEEERDQPDDLRRTHWVVVESC